MKKGGIMADEEQQLFLMEFLVDRVNVPTVQAMQEEILPSTTCVSFQILNLPPINIHQGDPSIECTCPPPADNATTTTRLTASAAAAAPVKNERMFKTGKSCLFALPAIVLEKPLYTFPVTMSVYKKLPAGVLPDMMLIGSHQIELKDLINSLIKEYVFVGDNPSKKIKDTFKIKTATGQPVGTVTVFIRVSCFGKKIITQFQMPHSQKPYIFKGANNGPTIQCKKINGEPNARDIDPSTRGVKPPSGKATQTTTNAAEKFQQRHMSMNPLLKSHPDTYLNSSVASENRSKSGFGKSAINLEQCACYRTHV